MASVDHREDTLRRIDALEEETRRLKSVLLSSQSQCGQSGTAFEALVFRVDTRLLAVSALEVAEVTPMVWVTPLPRAPVAVRGTIDFRGRLVPVFDLPYGLSGELSNLTPEMLLVVVAAGQRFFALATHDVIDVRDFGPEHLETTSVVSPMPGILQGLLRDEGGSIPLLEPRGILGAAELNLLHELLGAVENGGEAGP